MKRIMPGAMHRDAGRMVMVLWSILVGLVLLAPDPVWMRRWFTALYANMAVRCVVDMRWNEGITVHGLLPSMVEKAGPQLARAYFLFYLTLAILNETLIASVSHQAWVFCLSLLPLLGWVVSRALTNTILLSVGEEA